MKHFVLEIICLMLLIQDSVVSFNSSYTCANNFCLPKSYSALKAPRPENKTLTVFLKILKIDPKICPTLREVDDKRGLLTLDLELSTVWYDPRLLVSIGQPNIPNVISSLLWRPKLSLYSMQKANVQSFNSDLYTGKK